MLDTAKAERMIFMSDWQNGQEPQVPAGEPAGEPINVPASEPVDAPQEPVQEQTQEPVPPAENGWSSNGQWTPPSYTPPAYTPPPYTPPAGGWQPPQNAAPYGGWQQSPPPKKKKSSTAAILIAVLAAVCVICLCLSLISIFSDKKPGTGGGNTDNPNNESGNVINPDAPSIVTEEPEEEGLASREIVKKNLDSTVILRMYTKNNYNSNSLFFYYQQESDEETKAGEATGIVWTKDGYIITNAHCVFNKETQQEFSRIEVELHNGKVYDAKIVGYDTTTDLGVIKVDANDLTPAEFGDSNALELGDKALVLGNNAGLGWTVTGGLISGLARDVYEETNYAIKCLQVDAIINPGNSGGPLLNSSGQVVGVNSSKIVAEGYEGICFSIPINEAKVILEDLVKYGYVKGRIMLGIEGYTFNQYSGYEGFMISSIRQKSSFAGSDAQVGDIITHVDGVRVKSYAEMREQLTAHKVGDSVTITLIRIDRASRKVITLDVTITLLESDGTV